LQVVVLDYADPDQTDLIQASEDRAASFGFIHCVAPVKLDDIYHCNVTPKPDAKYLKPQTTPESMSVTLDSDRNGFPKGAVIVPSGCFGGYTVAPIVDGIADRSKLTWSEAAWASAEDGEPAWLEIRLPQSSSNHELLVDWQNGHASRAFDVQTKDSPQSSWREVLSIKDNRDQTSSIALPAKYQIIRIYQAPGGGSAKRPDLMWISQIKLKPRS
jgi:hypothetical protein